MIVYIYVIYRYYKIMEVNFKKWNGEITMSFFKRLKNVVSAKANKALEKHEDPIELLELSIGKKEKLLIDAKKQCANFIQQ